MKNRLYQMVHTRWETLRDTAENLTVSLNSQLTQQQKEGVHHEKRINEKNA